jgi:hypothetical protein
MKSFPLLPEAHPGWLSLQAEAVPVSPHPVQKYIRQPFPVLFRKNGSGFHF